MRLPDDAAFYYLSAYEYPPKLFLGDFFADNEENVLLMGVFEASAKAKTFLNVYNRKEIVL